MKKVMVIGAGRHGLKVIYPSLDLAKAKIEAVATRHLEKADEVVKRYHQDGIAYDDYHKMIQEVDCENVVIVLQANDAIEVVKDCLKAGKNVFVEKPCGMNRETAQEIHHLAIINKAKLHVGFMKRYADAYVKLKKIMDENTLGKALSFTSTFYVDARMFCEDDHSFIYFVAIHMLDLYRHLFGEIKVVSSIKNDQGDGCSYQCVFQSKEGVIGSVNFENRSAHTQECESIHVTFEEGYVLCDNVEVIKIHEAKSINESYTTLSEKFITYQSNYSPASGGEKDLYLRGFVGELEAFFSDTKDYSEDNIKTNELCDELLSRLDHHQKEFLSKN